MNVPLSIPNIGEEEISLVTQVLRSGWLAHGPKTKQFEEEFAKYMGTKFAISMNSCTSALHLAIQGAGLKGEVIVPSFTFSASANAIINAGCKPVFAEVRHDTCNIDPQKIPEKITRKTAGIMPVHYAGQSCEMDEIMEIAEKHGLAVIEDSAETIGGEYGGRKTGTFGTGCFSFFPTKNMTTGEGGMVTTDDPELAEKINVLKAHGMSTSTYEREKKERPWLRASIAAGYNFRMCDVLSAIGIAQLKKLDGMNELRRRHAKYLNKGLSGIEGIETPVESRKAKHVYQMYTIKVDTGRINRERFIAGLREKGIGASVHFDPPVHLQPLYMSMGCRKGDFPVTEKIAESIVTLPMYPALARKELDYIISSVEELAI